MSPQTMRARNERNAVAPSNGASMHDIASGRLVSINVGSVRAVTGGGRAYETAIGKVAAGGPVAVHGVNLTGDDQADRENHGGPDRALYAYAAEDYAWWEGELGRPLAAGLFGENLTTAGLDLAAAAVGERWRIGGVELEVSQPRVPCFKLASVVGDPHFVKRFAAALRLGPYLRIVREGEITAGDTIEVVSRPQPSVSMHRFGELYFDARLPVDELLAAPALSRPWRRWAEQRARRHDETETEP